MLSVCEVAPDTSKEITKDDTPPKEESEPAAVIEEAEKKESAAAAADVSAAADVELSDVEPEEPEIERPNPVTPDDYLFPVLKLLPAVEQGKYLCF